MKSVIFIFTLLYIAVSFAMQPAQWFRDVAPQVQAELNAELKAEDAAVATRELIALSRKFEEPIHDFNERRRIIQETKKLLERGANPNSEYSFYFNFSPVFHPQALISRPIPHYPEIVELLLQAGANPNSRASHSKALKDSVIFKAIEHNNPIIVASLLKHGADPDFKNELRESPLSSAVKSQDPEIVRLLLLAGANPNTFDLGGRTPLWHAVNLGNIGIIRLLLQAGADPQAQEKLSKYFGDTVAINLARKKITEAQTDAERNKYEEIVQMLEHPKEIKRVGLERLP